MQAAMLALSVVALAACSSAPQRQAQWRSPALASQPAYLKGSKILVACDFYDVALRQLCQDQLFRAVLAKGAEPIAANSSNLLEDRAPDGQLLAPAAASNAKAVLVMQLNPATTDAGSGSGFSIGLGGFGIGRNSAAGIGLSAPIGTPRVNTGFAANGRLTDVRTGQLMWTTSIVAAPSADLRAQFESLARSMLDEAQEAGVF
ncbi:conserved exported hypothetical protein [Burkholderiales bacterium 8X]|nr:conserved exported hypothetical protein [Burkholderiales bacterium 8X]